ncbi:hypothetical protein MRI28_11835 [Nocardiopsis dassonvillei]|uniref:hypothetical protein n=1 Tax=Nocardiopsis dassonvillei TaxID=2014 RepID=UPI00200E0DCD|nr:hypothetical protein [Nocardiopsis dassonvillei]MCK9870322.1 hypothetical protein [Nocardiopsis dassonvillei]
MCWRRKKKQGSDQSDSAENAGRRRFFWVALCAVVQVLGAAVAALLDLSRLLMRVSTFIMENGLEGLI